MKVHAAADQPRCGFTGCDVLTPSNFQNVQTFFLDQEIVPARHGGLLCPVALFWCVRPFQSPLPAGVSPFSDAVLWPHITSRKSKRKHISHSSWMCRCVGYRFAKNLPRSPFGVCVHLRFWSPLSENMLCPHWNITAWPR